jgi:hypothetical protein
MSSKGRGAPVTEAEFYPTPAWCTRRILEALPSHIPEHWVEPCAGDGAIVKVLQHRWAGDESAPAIHAGDIRVLPRISGVDTWACGTSFELWVDRHYDAVITNPPFSLAPEIVKHFLPRCDWLILLLRSSFKLVNGKPGTPERFDMRDNMPDEYKLPQRPSFLRSERCKGWPYGDPVAWSGACDWSLKSPLTVARTARCPGCAGYVQSSESDSSEYSWFVWTPERDRKFGRTCVLPDTPLSERNER